MSVLQNFCALNLVYIVGFHEIFTCSCAKNIGYNKYFHEIIEF